ncbi:MAG: nuclear transport factor 2 family protein [Armatimonadetes bacterium]|nr:nuclear transport factor 2 family protein [Armatimonadota bacterium]
MSEQVARKFIKALRALEEKGDLETITAMHTQDAAVGNVLRPDGFHGLEGARQFWTEYRGTFGRAESTFRNVIAGDGSAALEWTTEGTSFDGKPIYYAGVSILEIEGDKVKRFCAYFNPAALGDQVSP